MIPRLLSLLRCLARLAKPGRTDSGLLRQLLETTPSAHSGCQFAKAYNTSQPDSTAPTEANPIWDYFQAHREGRGIWKWEHYFDAYHRHFQRLRGQHVNILEI